MFMNGWLPDLTVRSENREDFEASVDELPDTLYAHENE